MRECDEDDEEEEEEDDEAALNSQFSPTTVSTFQQRASDVVIESPKEYFNRLLLRMSLSH